MFILAPVHQKLNLNTRIEERLEKSFEGDEVSTKATGLTEDNHALLTSLRSPSEVRIRLTPSIFELDQSRLDDAVITMPSSRGWQQLMERPSWQRFM
jgi:hypothetical protein